MPDFPNSPFLHNPISVNTLTTESLGTEIIASASSFVASTAWPSSNLAIFEPIEILYPVTIVQMAVNNGTAVSGNLDVGVYDVGGVKLVSSGSVAQAGTSAIQTFDITDTLLVPGLYYMAVALDNTTGTLAGFSVTTALDIRPAGLFQQASAFTLPSTFTAAAFAQTFYPLVTMTSKATI